MCSSFRDPHAKQHVGEVDRIHLLRLARRDERVQATQVLASLVRSCALSARVSASPPTCSGPRRA
jgi:hypothetical protein